MEKICCFLVGCSAAQIHELQSKANISAYLRENTRHFEAALTYRSGIWQVIWGCTVLKGIIGGYISLLLFWYRQAIKLAKLAELGYIIFCSACTFPKRFCISFSGIHFSEKVFRLCYQSFGAAFRFSRASPLVEIQIKNWNSSTNRRHF